MRFKFLVLLETYSLELGRVPTDSRDCSHPEAFEDRIAQINSKLESLDGVLREKGWDSHTTKPSRQRVKVRLIALEQPKPGYGLPSDVGEIIPQRKTRVC